MGIINKIMATVGIGSVSVDTVIENPSVSAGDDVSGYVTIKGGKIPQKIEEIYLYVMTKVEKENNNIKFSGKEKVQKVVIPVGQTVSKGDNLKLPFKFILNKQTPFSTMKTPVWIHTGLDIKNVLDPKDNDSLRVNAGPYLQSVLDAFERLDLVIYRVVNVEAFYDSSLPFLQQIEFRPTGSYKYELNYIKVMYILHEANLELVMYVSKGSKKMDLEDKKIRFYLDYQDLKSKDSFEISRIIKNKIEKQY
ncbi:MAG TPA: sporulation protein [Clostridiaceae bacterium]